MAGNLRIKHLPVDSLVPYAQNARTHSDAQVAQLAASIEEFGFTNPVLIDAGGVIIAGHGRVMAALKLGMDKVPCIVLDHLSEAQKRAYVLADNKLALNAGWDDALLGVELIEVSDLGVDLALTGFSERELKKFGVGGDDIEDAGARSIEIGADRNLLLIECDDEGALSALFEEMSERGLQCKVLD